MNDKIYHIYAKGQCIYHSLSKEKFEETWEMLHRMVDLIDVRLVKEDFSYEELTINKEAILNSSH
jgi:ornithine carbamoyltransferase